MDGLRIVAGIFAILSTAGIGAWAVINLVMGATLVPNVVILCGAGALFLAGVFGLVLTEATFIIAFILTILGWPALAVGLLFLFLPQWRKPAAL